VSRWALNFTNFSQKCATVSMSNFTTARFENRFIISQIIILYNINIITRTQGFSAPPSTCQVTWLAVTDLLVMTWTLWGAVGERAGLLLVNVRHCFQVTVRIHHLYAFNHSTPAPQFNDTNVQYFSFRSTYFSVITSSWDCFPKGLSKRNLYILMKQEFLPIRYDMIRYDTVD